MRPIPRRRTVTFGAAIIALGLLTACTAAPNPTRQAASTDTGAAITHIHAALRNPTTGELLLATHEGLFRLSGRGLLRSGPVIDLMSFTVGPDGTFYASGHPGAGVDLPQPVGLITSRDSGQTWQVAARGGQSDFHALAVGPAGVTGFDGALRTSSDHTTWTTRDIPGAPRSLAASPGSGTLLATTAAGLLRSASNGETWQTLTPPQSAVLAVWADEHTVVIATTTGRLATSSDAGDTWILAHEPLGAIDTLAAGRDAAGQVEIVVAVDGKVVQTTDGGATTQVLLP